MPFLLYDFVSPNGTNEIKAWTKTLQSTQRGKLNAKLDMLKITGDGLFPEILTGTDTPGILKLRVKGKVQLRPMLCKGPIEIAKEYTLLLGATEVGGKLKPAYADTIADNRKNKVKRDPEHRRRNHERVG